MKIKRKEPIIREIYDTYEFWMEGSDEDKGFCNMYIGLIIQDETTERQYNFLEYWESLKKYSLQDKETLNLWSKCIK